MNNHNLYRTSTRYNIKEIRSEICRHIFACLKRKKRALSIDEITRYVEKTLPTANQAPVRVQVAWHVRHTPYFVRAGKDHAGLPPKKQPTSIRHVRAA